MRKLMLFAALTLIAACGPQESNPFQQESGAAPAIGESGNAGTAPEVIKPAPVAPPTMPGVTLGSELPPKPAHSGQAMAVSATFTWSVKLTATSTYLWPTQYTTLTATANADVGPTPYYIRIWDGGAGQYVATCGSGTTCTASVTKATETFDEFTAVITDLNGYQQASSILMDIYWHGAELAVSASPTTVAVGASSTVTATTTQDIGPSPFYMEIFDTTTGTFLKSCGYGTSCSVAVSQAAATTHTFQAFLSSYSTALPPAGLQETTPPIYVSWANSGWSLSLSAPSSTYSTVTVTATASINVGSTPYYIEIFDENGTQLASCGSGTTCSVVFQPSTSGNNLVAFIASSSKSLPPPDIQAVSNVVTTSLLIPPR